MSLLNRIILIVASLLLFVSVFVPIWRIELDAPQYPEGMILQLYSNRLAGDVEIINGLNHYIGMRTLHAEDFVEFTVLPYILGGFGILILFISFLKSRNLLVFVWILFVLFGIASMVDFWYWEYEYGHNLDPTAAIIVPGMSYQPPLIGFKQLLNFGAYSVPDIGGWFMVLSGLLMTFVLMREFHWPKKIFPTVVILGSVMFLGGCGNSEAELIRQHSDSCDYCKMNISDMRYACSLLTSKGRTYKFDDLFCLVSFQNEAKEKGREIQSFYVYDYSGKHEPVLADQAFYIYSTELMSPMGGNMAGFAHKDSAEFYAHKFTTSVFPWKDILE
jgi:copper chaperone NosL